MRTKKYLAGGAVILAAATMASLIAASPAQDSYCGVCGARDAGRIYRLRFTALTLYRSDQVEATPFSTLLQEKHLVGPHTHQWMATRLVADPMNEFGPQVFESLAFLNAPRVVNFMRNLADYADPVSIAKWKDLVMQPGYARVIDAALRFRRVPEEGLADRTTFLAWWGDNSFAVYNRLREVTEPD